MKPNQIENSVQAEWASWEWLVLDDIKRLNYRLQSFHQAAALLGMSHQKRNEFVREQLLRLIEQEAKGDDNL